MVENNRNFHREKIDQKNGKNNQEQRQSSLPISTKRNQKNDEIAGSFDHVIGPDGSILAEVLWKKRRTEGNPYTFADESSIRELSSSLPVSQQRHLYLRSSEISLKKIESLINDSMLEQKRRAFIPAEPVAPKHPFTTHSTKIPTPAQSSSSNIIAPSRQQQNPQMEKENEGRQNSKEKDMIASHDQRLSNDYHQLQQRNHGPPSFYREGENGNASLEGANPQQTNKSRNFSAAATGNSRRVHPSEDDEYDDDDLFVDFDVDQAISEHNNNAPTNHKAAEMPMMSHVTNHEDRPYQEPEFDVRVSKYRNDVDSSTRGMQNDFDKNSSRKTSFLDNNNSSLSTYQQQHDLYRNDSSDFNSGSIWNENNNNTQQNSFHNGNDGDHPLCPGHGLPCRLLTANTSLNSGRQFYKCSLPEGQSCDFFQWKDGEEGNSNSNYWTSGNSGSIENGETLDMNQENRRVFGHRSFRRGQKDVIENAIQGRDVFVLMPTGYVHCFFFI
jgi:hypothetical protein